MTSKEALERLLKIAYVEPGPTKEKFITYAREIEHNKTCSELYNAIKQDLDKLEKFAHENASLHTEIESLHTENEKLKKVIEILKYVSDIELWISKDGKYYLIEFGYCKLITQEQYDLLKEYL